MCYLPYWNMYSASIPSSKICIAQEEFWDSTLQKWKYLHHCLGHLFKLPFRPCSLIWRSKIQSFFLWKCFYIMSPNYPLNIRPLIRLDDFKHQAIDRVRATSSQLITIKSTSFTVISQNYRWPKPEGVECPWCTHLRYLDAC